MLPHTKRCLASGYLAPRVPALGPGSTSLHHQAGLVKLRSCLHPEAFHSPQLHKVPARTATSGPPDSLLPAPSGSLCQQGSRPLSLPTVPFLAVAAAFPEPSNNQTGSKLSFWLVRAETAADPSSFPARQGRFILVWD